MEKREYKTIFDFSKAEFVEKKSVFIGSIMPVKTIEQATEFVALKKAEYKDATHNVWAYLLKDGQKRYSDDGEPQGTAGIPCLDVLEKSGIVDVCVVVTRYFGGILLGGGGLCRAYSHGAAIAVASSKLKLMEMAVKISLICEYGFYGKLSYMLPSHDAIIEESLFGEQVSLTLIIKQSLYDSFLKELTAMSNGNVIPQVVNTEFFNFS